MRLKACKNFLRGLAMLVFFSAGVWANNHHDINGTWTLVPTRSEFAGEPAIQTGTVTINDREHNIYISRNFTFDGANKTVAYNFATDGRENSSIKDGQSFKSKAKWEGDVLKVTTLQGPDSMIERYRLAGDGSLVLTVERPGHRPVMLFFQRQ